MPLTDAKVKVLYGRARQEEEVDKGEDGRGRTPQGTEIPAAPLSLCRKAAPLALDVYPDVSLKLARQARDYARALLVQDSDSGEQRKADRAEAKRRTWNPP